MFYDEGGDDDMGQDEDDMEDDPEVLIENQYFESKGEEYRERKKSRLCV